MMKKLTPLSKAILIGLAIGTVIWLVSCAIPAIPLLEADPV